jgi:hypothetical protein
MKVVALAYPTFDGLVCYTGLAKENEGDLSDTGDRIADWLNGVSDVRFFKAVELLQVRAQSYVAEVERNTGTRNKLTIIAAAFVNQRARAAVVSNFEDTAGHFLQAPTADMRVSWAAVKPGEQPVIIITGHKAAVSPTDRNDLFAEVVDAREDSGRVRRAIQGLNRSAHRNQGATDLISEECTVVSLDSAGSGFQEMDDVPGLALRHVNNGFNFGIADLLSQLGESATIVGAAFGTSKPANRKRPECRRDVVDFSDSGYTMEEVLHVVDLDCAVYGIDSHGQILGSHSKSDDRAMHRYWTCGIHEDGLEYLEIDPLINPGGCMSPGGRFVVLMNVGGVWTPKVFEAGRPERTLEVSEGMGEVELAAINDSGSVCGTIATNQDDTDLDRFRPAYWSPSGEILILWDQGLGSGARAVAMNEDELVLVWDRVNDSRSSTVLWTPHGGGLVEIEGEIIPTSLTSSGPILGFDRKSAVASYDRRTWSRLRANDGFIPTGCNDEFDVIGWVTMDGYGTGWALKDDALVLLPGFRFHSAYPCFINESGVVAGKLTADHEQHIVLWYPE